VSEAAEPEAATPADPQPVGQKPIEVALYDVTKRFGATTAVDGITVEIARGEFFSLLGPSGCGKTTSLRMIAGFEEPDEGRVVLAGNEITGVPPYKRNVNTVFQSYALFPHLTVADNVAFGLRRKKLPKKQIAERVGHYLDLVELHGYDKRRPSQLSGGQQQRVALARALVNEPSVLLLDEPLGALDLKLRKQMQLELMRIQREVGVTFIYVTHDQEEALVMSDRIAVMSDGHVEQIGFPEDIYERPATRFVAGFIGTSNIIEGDVAGRTGDLLELGAAPGDRLLVAPPTDRAIRQGDHIAFTVRPEKLRVGGIDQPIPGDMCTTAGTVVDVVYQGMSTQLVVRTDEGATLVAFRQNNERVSDAGVPGHRVRLMWGPEFNVVLAEQPSEQEDES
jgi:spermidine/putrescine transport system ATP-binding protein